MKITSLFLLLLISNFCFSQIDTSLQKLNALPNYKVTLLDHKEIVFDKLFQMNQSTVIIMFSPDCDHCQDEIKMIAKNIDSFKNVNFILASNRPIHLLKDFAIKFKINKIENFKFISEPTNNLIRFYGVPGFPSMIIYNKDKKCQKTYLSSTVSMKDIIRYTQ